MKTEEILAKIYDAIIELDEAKTLEMVNMVLNEGLDAIEVISQAMSPAMVEVGKGFENGKMFLPELLLSADIYQAAMNILQPKILEAGGTVEALGKVVIGTVKGDIHAIGKNLVSTMLRTAGFEVHDLGIDVPPLTFVAQAEKFQADVIALSALLTTTMESQRVVIEALTVEGLRDRFKVIIGGAPVSRQWAEEIKADGYGKDAVQAVQVTKQLCS